MTSLWKCCLVCYYKYFFYLSLSGVKLLFVSWIFWAMKRGLFWLVTLNLWLAWGYSTEVITQFVVFCSWHVWREDKNVDIVYDLMFGLMTFQYSKTYAVFLFNKIIERKGKVPPALGSTLITWIILLCRVCRGGGLW